MDPDRAGQVYQLFEAALRCDPADRGAFLDAGCGGDADLRDEVERLLAEDEGASRDQFLAEVPHPGAAGADTIGCGLRGLESGRRGRPLSSLPEPDRADSGSGLGRGELPGVRLDIPSRRRQYGHLGPPVQGQRLGRFELLQAVGSGAFGTVFKAHDPKLDRTVAVKVPRAGSVPDGQELDRFLREARSTAQLHHPAIVPVYETGQDEGVPFLVSEFVDGVTLGDRLTAGGFAFGEAAKLLAGVADALEHAHRQGIVHRDVKPSNIMLRTDGTPAVMDFGLARRMAGDITMTLTGQVLGTPAYMSPEQAGGSGHTVDGRSDVYSLGVILYRLLAGELPFRGNQRMLLHQVLQEDPRPPRAERPGAAGPGDDLPEGHGQGAAPAVCNGGGAGGRLAALAGQGADHSAAGGLVRARLAVVPAPAGAGDGRSGHDVGPDGGDIGLGPGLRARQASAGRGAGQAARAGHPAPRSRAGQAPPTSSALRPCGGRLDWRWIRA